MEANNHSDLELLLELMSRPGVSCTDRYFLFVVDIYIFFRMKDSFYDYVRLRGTAIVLRGVDHDAMMVAEVFRLLYK